MHEDAHLEAQYEERWSLQEDDEDRYPDEDEDGGLDPFAVADWPSSHTSEPSAEDEERYCGDCDADTLGNDPHAPGCRFGDSPAPVPEGRYPSGPYEEGMRRAIVAETPPEEVCPHGLSSWLCMGPSHYPTTSQEAAGVLYPGQL